MSSLIRFVAGFLLILSSLAARASLQVESLRCEYITNPLAIDVTHPRLSWTVKSKDRAQTQTAYQILISTSIKDLDNGRGDLWDSGVVKTNQTCQINYEGKPLASRAGVFWKVRVWDQDGHASPWSQPARWSMGLLRPEDWKAQWIAEPHSLTNSQARGPLNGFHSQMVGTAATTQSVTIALTQRALIDSIRLFPARPYDWQKDEPGFLFPLRFTIDAAESENFSDARIVVDRTQEDEPNPGTNSVLYQFPAVPARYVRLRVIRLRERDPGNHAFALAEMQVSAGDQNVALGGIVSASNSIENGPWAKTNLVDGVLQTVPPATQSASLPASMFRKSFNLPGQVKQATAYVTGLGLYELRLNGRRVGDHLLAPEWTDYRKRIQYQSFDVTGLLHAGDNAVAAIVGEGWYAGRMFSVGRFAYGSVPRFLLQLEIELNNGEKQLVVTDNSWRSTLEGPIRHSSIYDGEEIDARKTWNDWDQPRFDDHAWQPVSIFQPGSAALVAQPNEPIRVMQELKPVSLSVPGQGNYVFDLGQNMVGWCRFTTRGPAGTRIRFRYAEMLNPDGTVYTANLRGAAQTDFFTTRGSGAETFEPHFTYHGFRYVEITGVAEPPRKDDLVGRVFYSAAPDTGHFESSSPQLNQLVKNIYWTQRGNLMSSPTDCPQRDERFGWMGDIQAFSQTAIYNMDMAAFFTKWIRDVRDDQADDGRYPDFAPHPGDPNRQFSGVPAWGDAGTVVPWRMYENYGDTRVLAEHFESARRWVDYIHKLNPDLIWSKGRNNDYNDWLNGDTLIHSGWPRSGGAVPKDVFATAFFAHSTDLVACMARVLRMSTEAQAYTALFERIKTAFNQRFVSDDGHIQGDTQAGYALALNFDLLPDSARSNAVQWMLQNIDKYHGHLSTGIQSSHRLMLELSSSGHHAVACRVLSLSDFPSWGMMLANGATTIWERWDGFVKDRGFQDPGMNSFNHWAFGAVGEWIWRDLAGINPDPANPGFQHFIISPKPGGDLTWLKARYISIRGPISTEWRQDSSGFSLKVEVPANTSATIYMPASSPASVTESGRPIQKVKGVTQQAVAQGSCVLDVQSGSYNFHSR